MFSILAMNRRAGSISKIMTKICIDCMAPTGHFASSWGDRHCFSGSLSLLLLSDPQHGALDQWISGSVSDRSRFGPLWRRHVLLCERHPTVPRPPATFSDVFIFPRPFKIFGAVQVVYCCFIPQYKSCPCVFRVIILRVRNKQVLSLTPRPAKLSEPSGLAEVAINETIRYIQIIFRYFFSKCVPAM